MPLPYKYIGNDKVDRNFWPASYKINTNISRQQKHVSHFSATLLNFNIKRVHQLLKCTEMMVHKTENHFLCGMKHEFCKLLKATVVFE